MCRFPNAIQFCENFAHLKSLCKCRYINPYALQRLSDQSLSFLFFPVPCLELLVSEEQLYFSLFFRHTMQLIQTSWLE